MMIGSRFIRLYRALFLLVLGFLPACLGATGPAGNPAAGVGDSGFGSSESGVEAKADGGGVTTDIAQADAGKPHPGGSSAPSNEWQEPTVYHLIGSSEVQCSEPAPPLAKPVAVYRYRLKGKVWELHEDEFPPLKPLESCAGRVVRAMKGVSTSNLGAISCQDFVLNANCEVEMTVSRMVFLEWTEEDPAFDDIRFGLSGQAAEPGAIPCDKDLVSDKEGSVLLPLAGVVDWEIPQGAVPACPVRRSL